ncbi:hypothetical protein QUA93_09425 [Microcoleus sp. F10-B6]
MIADKSALGRVRRYQIFDWEIFEGDAPYGIRGIDGGYNQIL